jgi:nucleotide-binding universal stress UspA family protein
MQFRTIIAAIDLDDDLSDGVIRAAKSLAQKDDANLEVVSAWPLVSAMTPTFSTEVAVSSAVLSESVIDMHRKGREESEKKLRALVARLAPDAKAVVVDGDPADAVADYAESMNADLIVTGSHQRNFWNALFQGSASRELVREAPCAVFLVTKAFVEKHSL